MKAGTRIRAGMNAGPKELNEDFIRSLPDNGPEPRPTPWQPGRTIAKFRDSEGNHMVIISR